MSERESSGPAHRDSWIGLGALAVILCCAGPVLLAGGALGAVGGFLGNPLVIALGVVLVLGAVAVTAYARARRSHACAPPATEDRHADVHRNPRDAAADERRKEAADG